MDLTSLFVKTFLFILFIFVVITTTINIFSYLRKRKNGHIIKSHDELKDFNKKMIKTKKEEKK